MTKRRNEQRKEGRTEHTQKERRNKGRTREGMKKRGNKPGKE
jgi:hypothetical protein